MQPGDAKANAWEAQQARLREALRRDEFELYLQPIVELQRRGTWRMAEVLIRLRQEERALLPPGDFLPAFELFGMLPQLDAWVLRKVVKQRAPVHFSINISAPTLEHEGFLRLLGDVGASRDSLLFEIEEADIVQRPQAAQRFSETVRAFGGGVVIDGFGRRSLSFASFASLSPAFVKIDGALTRPLRTGDPAAVARVQAIRRLAEASGVGLIAESVEEPEVLQQLESLGVTHAQGYGLSQPQPLEELLAREPQLAAA